MKPAWRIPVLSRLKVRSQIALVFCLAIVFPVLLLGFFTMKQTVEILYDRAYQQLESDNNQARSVLLDATVNFYTISSELVQDASLQAILQQDFAGPKEARAAAGSYSRLESTMMNNPAISSIRVYTENQAFADNGYVWKASGDQVEEWFEKTSTPGSAYWESSVSDQSGGGLPELTLVRSFPFPDNQKPAILVIRMSYNYLKNRIQTNDYFISLSINQDPIFFSTRRSLQGTFETASIDYNESYFYSRGTAHYQGREALSYITTFTPYMGGTSSIYVVSADFSALEYISDFMQMSGAIFLIAVVVPCLVILVFTKWFTQRVTHLKNAMHDAAQGDFNTIEPFKGDDELSSIFVDLQNMIANVQEQQAKIYRSQLKEQEMINQQQKMEFKLLASQINPHFIYNTLETIRMMALCDGARDVASATALFGKTMRYVLENTGTNQTTLDKELDYVENYLAIQKLRFDDKVNYAMEVSPELDPGGYQILPLLLQPIVENAISHGIKECPHQGMIRIRVWVEEGKELRIQVSDNGVGISSEELEQLQAHIAGRDGEMVTSSIGLFNINRRIKLFYGEEFGFTIESENNAGTSVTLRLPLLSV